MTFELDKPGFQTHLYYLLTILLIFPCESQFPPKGHGSSVMEVVAWIKWNKADELLTHSS